MNTPKQSLLVRVLTRMTLGAVPVDGMYWHERIAPQAGKARDTVETTPRKRTPEHHEITAVPAGPVARRT
jgi:hypothetical protein